MMALNIICEVFFGGFAPHFFRGALSGQWHSNGSYTSLLYCMAVGLSQSLAQQSGTVSQISSGTRQSALTLSDVY